ncbi:MAG: hypothetical protein GEU28_07790 [Dehalococcoidia bacterium]|nr:hypothetical protein [Dehalococcoidia bacterium]
MNIPTPRRIAAGATSLLQRLAHGERGAVLVLVAGGMVTFGGFVALSVDVGRLYVERGQLSNVADSAALAGAQSLHLGHGAAEDDAYEWAERNGLNPDEVEVDFNRRCDGGGKAYTIRVRVERDVDLTFARLLGFDDADVGSCAVSKLGGFGALTNVIPLSVEEDAINYNGTTLLKYDASNKSGANTSPLRLDGPGAAVYREALKYGAQKQVCAKETGSFMGSACRTFTTQPGNVIGPTRQGIEFRLDNTIAACDTFDEVFSLRDDGMYGIRAGCNPFQGDTGSRRVVIVPVIDDLPQNGASSVEIIRFAIFWLEELDTCTGKNCQVRGTFVKAITDIEGGVFGIPDADRALNVPRLVDVD